MLRLLRLTLITLTLAVPAVSHALGLGDIHIQSALHQPLVAQIELVGVAEDELGRVSASLASDELFQKYNLERAPFIYGTKLSVGRDAQGRAVLNMRSTEKFTEPVVTLLVDMHSPSGELVREYTLFLDPVGLGDHAGAESNSQPAAVVPAGSVASNGPASSNAAATSAPAAAGASSKLLGTKYTVARRDTLARIVTATGARTRTERHRMMIAIYRTNRAAFQNNFNRMHTGVTLTFPTAEQLAAISVDETNREYDTQMAEWRASLHHGSLVADSATAGAGNRAASHDGAGSVAANAAAAAIAASNARNAEVPKGETLPTDHAALTQRIASLEQSLALIQQQLKRPLPVQSPAAAIAAATSAIADSLVTNRAAVPTKAASEIRSAVASSSASASAPAASRTAVPNSAARETAVASANPAALTAGHLPANPAALATGQLPANPAAFATGQPPANPAALAADQPPTNPAALATGQAAAASRGAPAQTASARPTAVAAAPAVEDESASDDDENDTPQPKHRGYQLLAIGAGAGLLFFAGAWFYLRRRNDASHIAPRYPVPVATATAATEKNVTEAKSSNEVEFSTPPPALTQPATKTSEPVEAQQQPTTPKNTASWFEDSFSTPIADLLADPTVSLGTEDMTKLTFDLVETLELPKHTSEQTRDTELLVAPELEFIGDTVEQKFSFVNPEATNHTEHVVMGSALTEPKPFVERRKNPADVLRQAIEREPDRSDLRLKLVELYYTAAAENRRAFLEATRQLAKKESLASPEDWSRIADMGRIIAPDDELFAGDGDSEVDGKRVA